MANLASFQPAEKIWPGILLTPNRSVFHSIYTELMNQVEF